MSLRDRQIEEGAKRMKALKMLRQPILEFKKEGLVNLSEGIGYLYWLNDFERGIVANFEVEHDCTVYHVIKSVVDVGGEEMTTYAMLYVSQWERDWAEEMRNLRNGEAYAYVYNATHPDSSEIGCIGVKPSIGGVRRVW